MLDLISVRLSEIVKVARSQAASGEGVNESSELGGVSSSSMSSESS